MPWKTTFAVIILVAESTARAAVLPATATPNGYSLNSLAQATAAYNAAEANGITTVPVPNVPFTVLVNPPAAFSVPQNRYLYVPLFVDDNSPPADPNFPTDLSNQQADATYLDAALNGGLGITSLYARIDGVTTPITDGYVVGINTPPLPDGGGTEYIVSAFVASPLSPGLHEVDYGGIISGTPTDFGNYAVTVVPEPTSAAVALAAALLVRRHRIVVRQS